MSTKRNLATLLAANPELIGQIAVEGEASVNVFTCVDTVRSPEIELGGGWRGSAG